MSRIEFIKRDWWRVVIMLALTASLPFMTEWHNPAGAQPLAIFGAITVMFWAGFIGMMVISDKARADFFDA